MTDTTVLDAPVGAAPPPAKASRLPFSPRTMLAVGVALVVAVGGAIYIVSPKPSEATDAAYIQADSSVVAPKVRGLISEVLVAHNQVVHKGDPLIRIDPEEFDAHVAAASADLQKAQAAVLASQAALTSLGAEEALVGGDGLVEVVDRHTEVMDSPSCHCLRC